MYRKVKEMEQEINYYSSENQELKNTLKKYQEKEENERKYRTEIEKARKKIYIIHNLSNPISNIIHNPSNPFFYNIKVKKDILSVRHNEVQKLSEAFDTMFTPMANHNEGRSNSGSQLVDKPKKKDDFSRRKYDTLKI